MASAAYDIVKERLDGGEVVLLDGAISTEIEKRGVPMDQLVWSGMGSKIGSETLLGVHKDYIRAGADVITTNTFSSARHSLKVAGHGELTREVNAAAVALAKQAVEEVSEEGRCWWRDRYHRSGLTPRFWGMSRHRSTSSKIATGNRRRYWLMRVSICSFWRC